MTEKGKSKAPDAGPHPSGPDLAGLQAMIARAGDAKRGLAPVDQWEPRFCGDIDMKIEADGTWFYMGTPIGRPALVRLFASVLRKDADGKTYLVTPVEKVGIAVADAHFLAVEMHRGTRNGAQVLTFRTNVGDLVEAGPDHPLRFLVEAKTGGVKPYLAVRGRLEALVSRSIMYDLVALGEHATVDGRSRYVVRSNGMAFAIMNSAALEDLAH